MEAATEHHMRIILPGAGDEHITWDPNDKKSVAKAEEKFKEHVVAGHHSAFPVVHQPVADEDAGPLREFKPELGEIVLVPAMAGG